MSPEEREHIEVIRAHLDEWGETDDKDTLWLLDLAERQEAAERAPCDFCGLPNNEHTVIHPKNAETGSSTPVYAAAVRATEAARYRGLVDIAREIHVWGTTKAMFDTADEAIAAMEADEMLFERLGAALAENPAPARPERDIAKPPIIVGIDVEDEEWMNAPLGTPRPTEYDTLLRQYRELEAKAGDDALRTRLTDEAMVERVAEAVRREEVRMADEAEDQGLRGVSLGFGYYERLARAALAVIAEEEGADAGGQTQTT